MQKVHLREFIYLVIRTELSFVDILEICCKKGLDSTVI